MDTINLPCLNALTLLTLYLTQQAVRNRIGVCPVEYCLISTPLK